MSLADDMFAGALGIARAMAKLEAEKRERQRLKRNELARHRYRIKPKINRLSKEEKLLAEQKRREEEHEERMLIAEYAMEHCTCHLGNPPCTYCVNKNDDEE